MKFFGPKIEGGMHEDRNSVQRIFTSKMMELQNKLEKSELTDEEKAAMREKMNALLNFASVQPARFDVLSEVERELSIERGNVRRIEELIVTAYFDPSEIEFLIKAKELFEKKVAEAESKVTTLKQQLGN